MIDYFSKISYLMIETNTQCNLHCQWCNRDQLKARGDRENFSHSHASFLKILEPFSACPIDTVKIEGLSEPFLLPEFDQLALTVRKKFKNAFIIIATNLQYEITKTAFENTLPWVDMVYLSIDATENQYERIRKGASWSRLQKNLQWIKENVSSEYRKKLFINTTVSLENATELPQLYRIQAKYQLAGVRINLAQNWSVNQTNPYNHDEQLIPLLQNFKKDIKGVADWELKDCFWPFSGVVVDAFGNMRTCIIKTDSRPIGNVLSDDPRKVFNSSVAQQEIRQALSHNSACSHCKNCDYKGLANILDKLQVSNQARRVLPVVEGMALE